MAMDSDVLYSGMVQYGYEFESIGCDSVLA